MTTKTQTIGERYEPAMKVETQVEADRYFEQLVTDQLEAGVPREKAEDIERANLGYFAGYYDRETRERVERLFRCKHPVLGSVAESEAMTPRDILERGMRLGTIARVAARLRQLRHNTVAASSTLHDAITRSAEMLEDGKSFGEVAEKLESIASWDVATRVAEELRALAVSLKTPLLAVRQDER
jgi:hypothetical protein